MDIITTTDLCCEHPTDSLEYQPEEKENNAQESLYCTSCGKSLDPNTLEPDWDEMGKEEKYEENNE
jgi:hypothetical protein